MKEKEKKEKQSKFNMLFLGVNQTILPFECKKKGIWCANL